MGSFKILDGDFKKGGGNAFVFGSLGIYNGKNLLSETIPGTQIADVGLVSDETVKIGDPFLLAAAGALLWGTTGAVLGALYGNSDVRSVKFVCILDDGRKFLGEGSPKLFEQLSAKAKENKIKKEQEEQIEKARTADPVGEAVRKSARARWGRT